MVIPSEDGQDVIVEYEDEQQPYYNDQMNRRIRFN
jgi:hypothetical protein